VIIEFVLGLNQSDGEIDGVDNFGGRSGPSRQREMATF
jgi:hypothetical protein